MHIRQYRRLQTGRKTLSRVSHGRQGGYEFRIVATLASEGWRMQIRILDGMRCVAEYQHKEAYDDDEVLRIAAIVIAYEMIGRLPPLE